MCPYSESHQSSIYSQALFPQHLFQHNSYSSRPSECSLVFGLSNQLLYDIWSLLFMIRDSQESKALSPPLPLSFGEEILVPRHTHTMPW